MTGSDNRCRTADFGTFRIFEQRRLGRVCEHAQTRQSLRCSHTQGIGKDEDSDQTVLDTYARVFKGGACAYAISAKISCTGT